MTDVSKLTVEERELVSRLRAEATEVKECFTRYSFQAFALAAAAMGIVIPLQVTYPVVGFASVGAVILLLTIADIGCYKLATVNRILGYELHLERTRWLVDSTGDGWKRYMRTIGWEEAMRAWRIVQATAREELYGPAQHPEAPAMFWRWSVERLRQPYSESSRLWFEPETLLPDGSVYKAGGYLRSVLNILHAIVAMFVATLIVMLFQLLGQATAPLLIAAIVCTTTTAVVVAIRWRQITARCEQLESGVLSIHTCAVMWQAAVVAHYRALRHLEGGTYDGYTCELGRQARSLAASILDVDKWIERGEAARSSQRTPGSTGL